MEGINLDLIYAASRYLPGEGDEKQENEDNRSSFRDFKPESSQHAVGATKRP
jgi:hypothetical protein